MDWTLAPEFMVRIAGLPVDVLEPLRCGRSLCWSEAVLGAEDRLRMQAQDLSDDLAEAIGRIDSQPDRAALVRVRRDIFNLRMPADPATATRLVDGLAPDVGAALAAWVDDRRRFEALRTEGPGLLAAETDQSREQLRRLMQEPRMRSGLLLAAPVLEAQLDAFVGDPAAVPDKRTRKIERSAVNYVYRTAGKPSPFSTFTGVALGRFADAAETGLTQTVADQWTSRVRVSVVALSRLFDAVLADPGRRGDLPVVPASGWGRDEDRVRYVRRSLRTGDASATVTFDAARDQLFFLRRSHILEGMLALVTDGPAPLYRDLAAWLGDQLDASAVDCEQYLAALLDLGMLQVPLLATNVHSADPLRTFRDALMEVGRPWSLRLAGALAAPIGCLDEYAAADPERRRALLAELRRGLGVAMESLGAPAAGLPSTLVYEDVRTDADALLCDAAQWDDINTPLRTLERMLPAFDQSLRHKQTLHGFFLARFGPGGRCEDLLSLVHDFHEDIYDEYQSYTARHSRLDESGRLVPDPNWLANPRIAALDSARARFAERLGHLAETHPDAVELELGTDLVTAVTDELGEPSAGFTALTHFLQRAKGEPASLVVHNSAYGGLSFPFSRFTHCFEQPEGQPGLSQRLLERARRLSPPGTVFAEVTGGFATSNLNLHAPLTDYEIVCPGEVSAAPEAQRIELADLVLDHDPDADRLVLRSKRLGCEVVPVYLGYLVPQALPAISRTLLLLSASATFWLDPWAGVPAGDRPTAGPVHRPRLRIGPLVLSRRSWTLSADSLPVGAGTAGADELFLAWQRWRRQHGIPTRVFARIRPLEGQARGSRPSKPHLVDFAGVLSLAAFRTMLTDPGTQVVLTEMLPDSDQLHVRSDAGSHVAELAVETVSYRSVAATPRAAAIPTQRSA